MMFEIFKISMWNAGEGALHSTPFFIGIAGVSLWKKCAQQRILRFQRNTSIRGNGPGAIQDITGSFDSLFMGDKIRRIRRFHRCVIVTCGIAIPILNFFVNSSKSYKIGVVLFNTFTLLTVAKLEYCVFKAEIGQHLNMPANLDYNLINRIKECWKTYGEDIIMAGVVFPLVTGCVVYLATFFIRNVVEITKIFGQRLSS